MAPINGRIDVHFHVVPEVYRQALVEASSGARQPPPWSLAASLELMDRSGIGVGVTSVATSLTFMPDARRPELARRCNDASAALIAERPRQFGAFAAMPLPNPKASCTEIRRALEDLKLDGVVMFSNYDGRHLGHSDFAPVLELLNDHAAVVLIHPTASPGSETMTMGLPIPLIEFAFETTRCAVDLLFSGALDRYPRIRFILAHAGGTLPYLAWRISHLAADHFSHPYFRQQFPTPLIEQNPGPLTPDLVLSRLRRFWFDTALAPGRGTFAALEEIADPERIMFGSDWPYAPGKVVDDEISALATPGLHDERRRRAIDRDNALRLFPRLA